ncbi:hypothetical protein [Sporosarcina sp. Te-1]|uniref:hypothetical protein n=1 Tax=Sporosarcina sp. Te-1 TaxID=2818390 RepID=UPI001A9D013E|nr:hypothetical protein [Sporosarcina sp. Te-1]QTD41896.1 hypothetical protein J3U78_03310 [Sporosarcina sp. Te-1]
MDYMRNGHHHGERRRGREGSPSRGGAKTFRRGRVIAFLETLQVKRATIADQLKKPEFQSIEQILIGELKAIDLVIDEYKNLFEIQEGETSATESASAEHTEEGENEEH